MDNFEKLILPIVLAILGSGAFSTLISALVSRIGRRDPVKAGLKMLLRDKLEYLIVQTLKEGTVTTSRRRMIREMWQSYEDLGGNGELTALMTELDDLPLKGV